MYKSIRRWIWERHFSNLYKSRHELILRLLPRIDITGKMLDIGSGDGFLAAEIAKHYELNLVGIDTTCNLKDHSMRFALADGCYMPFSEGIFNLVTAISIIEHVPRDHRDDFLTEVRRVLSPDSTFILQLPNRYFPVEPHSYLPFVGYFPPRIQSFLYTNHCDIPSLKEVEELLKENHFSINKLISYKIKHLHLPKNIFNLIKIIPLKNKIPFGYIILARPTK